MVQAAEAHVVPCPEQCFVETTAPFAGQFVLPAPSSVLLCLDLCVMIERDMPRAHALQKTSLNSCQWLLEET